MKHLANPAVPGSENIPAPTDVDVYARIMVVVEAVNVQVTVAGKRARSSFFRKAQKKHTSKRKAKHVLQTVPTEVTSSTSSNTNIAFKFNFLEICFISAIILHLQNLHGNTAVWNSEKVNEIYLLMMSNLLHLGIVLPLNRYPLTKIESEIKKLKKHFDSDLHH